MNKLLEIGARNNAKERREKNDFYATDPIAIDKLASVHKIPHIIVEPACGQGHLSERLKTLGHYVYAGDIVYRGLFEQSVCDFLKVDKLPKGASVLTNPPFKLAKEFVLKGLDLVDDGNEVIMFLKLQFLEGKTRKKELFDKYPPKVIYVSSGRIRTAMNGEFEKYGSQALAYGWFVWEKGYKGDTTIKWLDTTRAKIVAIEELKDRINAYFRISDDGYEYCFVVVYFRADENGKLVAELDDTYSNKDIKKKVFKLNRDRFDKFFSSSYI